MFTEVLSTIDKIWKQPVSINRWIDKEDVVYIYIHTHTHTHTQSNTTQPLKKQRKFAICSNMDGLGGYYSKWNKLERERHIVYYHLYV